MKKKFKKLVRMIGFHGRVLIKGFTKALLGTLQVALVAFAVHWFTLIPSEEGYWAVLHFLLAACDLVIGIGGIYHMGTTKKEAK